MKGSKVHEHEADVPASDLWAICGSLRAAELLPELLPHVLAKVELVSGDGGGDDSAAGGPAQGAGEQGARGVREDEEARGGEDAEGHKP